MSKRLIAAGFVAFATISLAQPLSAFAGPKEFLKAVDTDNDGTVTLDEVKAYAAQRFQALEKDKDGTLDMKELKGRLSAAGFRKADGDNDKTLDQTEFMAVVEDLFKKANDNDDTLDAKELRSPAGRKLMKLLQ